MKRLATSRDVAKLAGVSQATVSRALSGGGNVSPETTERVLRAAESLGYVVNETARSVRTKRSGSIGVVLPSLVNPFYAETAHAIYDGARQAGRRTLIELTLNNAQQNRDVVMDLVKRRVDGLLLASVAAQDAFMKEYLKNPVVPSVMYNRKLTEDIGNWVVLDNKYGASQAVKYLLLQGHQRILFISGDILYSTGIDRLAGYLAAIEEAGHEPFVVYGNYDYIQSYEAVGHVLDEGRGHELPTAILAANDVMAVAAIDALTDRGLKPKSDVAVIGFDDISMASHRGIRLTTVSQNQEIMVRIALEGLFRLIEGTVQVVRRVIPPELIIRNTA